MNAEISREFNHTLDKNNLSVTKQLSIDTKNAVEKAGTENTRLHLVNSCIDKAWVYGKSMSMLVTFNFKVEDELIKQAQRHISDYLKRARLALRVHGGASEMPLVEATAFAGKQGQRYAFRHVSKSDSVFKNQPSAAESSYSYYGYPKIKDEDACQLILQNKIDLDSLYAIFGPMMSGDQKWSNVKNRFSGHWKPKLIFVLSKGILEVPKT